MPSLESYYSEYPCSNNNPLKCDRPSQTAQEMKGAKFCLECGFPANLSLEAEIKGNRGSYQVTKFLGVRGLGRLYLGVQLNDKEPVLIKEYLLPSRCFNVNETLKRKEAFKRLGGVYLADGRIQNFRLIQTWEAIADQKGERCYLITQGAEPTQTLSKYLTENGAMKPSAVREFLNQALQTLEFLHTQKLRFPSNQTQQGLSHGNINLDSILIKVERNQQFYIYFSDLAIWENLFIPAVIPQPPATKFQQDLESLGKVAFCLWIGRVTNYSHQLIDFRDDRQLPSNDNNLKQFLCSLIGLSTPFESAEAARLELLKLPKDDNKIFRGEVAEETEKRWRKPLILLGILALLLLGGGIWYYFLRRNYAENNNYLAWRELKRNFSEVDKIPPGIFNYTGEKNGTWTLILTQRPDGEKILKDILNSPKPEETTRFNYEEVTSPNIQTVSKPLEEVLANKKYFAITSLEDKIGNELDKKPVAYDGLLVFVAFSQNSFNLPQALEGKITLEQLRKIYTGEITNWQQINPKFPSLLIEPYAPQEAEAIQQFKKIVLEDNAQNIAKFDDVVKNRTEATLSTQNRIRALAGKGKNTGIISFGILSKTQNQCSGYPLAIANTNNQAIQPLFLSAEHRKITPSDDFCKRGANYFDVESFQRDKIDNYPLGYPLYAVYPRDDSRRVAGSIPGSIFADMLKTRQGQCLLNRVGLVPLQPIPDEIKNYACESVP